MTQALADRQGDVILVASDREPRETRQRLAAHKVAPKNGRLVLAEGEVTGHAHVMEPKGVEMFVTPRGPTLLVVTETTVRRGALIEGKVVEKLPDGTLRFQITDGVVMRFAPEDVQIVKQGVKVKRAYTPLTHDEHDGIPVSVGVYDVVIQHTADVRNVRRQVSD